MGGELPGGKSEQQQWNPKQQHQQHRLTGVKQDPVLYLSQQPREQVRRPQNAQDMVADFFVDDNTSSIPAASASNASLSAISASATSAATTSISQHTEMSRNVDSRQHDRSQPRPQLVSNVAIPNLGLGILSPQAAAKKHAQQQQQHAVAEAKHHFGNMSRSSRRDPIDAANARVLQEQQRRQSMSPSARRSVERPASLQATASEDVDEKSSGPMSPETALVKNGKELEML